MNRSTSMYQDMASRTGSSIYIGVVGPVRTGKSTFIKRFMETQVLPNIENDYRRERARDELPQSGSGRTIMTAEPKFVPEEAAEVRLPDGTSFSVRLIDCVGYMVPGAVGQFEDLAPRMVMTPWYDHEIPMTEAAENVVTAQVTYAARNSDFDGFAISAGDYLALTDGKLFGTDQKLETLLDQLAALAADKGAEFITVFYGDGVTQEDAQRAEQRFADACPEAEVSMLPGGQPVYYYIISIE